MTTPKVKKTVSLDADLVAAVGEGNLSAEVNEALRRRVDTVRREAALAGYLDRMAAEEGPVDEGEVREFMRLLSGGAEPTAIRPA